MKKRQIILITLALIASIASQAQLKVGVLAGGNFSKLNSTNPVSISKNLISWQGGAMAEIKLPILSIEVDALYIQNGSKFDIKTAIQELKNTYITIPVLAKMYFFEILNIHAGPQFSFLTSSKFNSANFQNQLKSSDLHIVFGAGVEFERFYSSFRYNLGVKDINLNSVFELKNNNIMISAGFWLIK